MTTGGRPVGSVIEVRGARPNNLASVDVDVPKRALVVFTGVSGSGKSSLVFGTIAAESQRLLNETYPAFLQSLMPALPRPAVDRISGLNAAIVVDQERMGANSRSTVGTATDTWTMLRVLFARAGSPPVASASALSFNDPSGMCPTCEGMGTVASLDVDAVLDRSLSLAGGAITFPNFAVGSLFWQIFADSGFFHVDKPLDQWTREELSGPGLAVPWRRRRVVEQSPIKGSRRSNPATYSGVLDGIREAFAKANKIKPALFSANSDGACPACNGLGVTYTPTWPTCQASPRPARRAPDAGSPPEVLEHRLRGADIAEVLAMTIEQASDFFTEKAVRPVLRSLTDVGIGYITLPLYAADGVGMAHRRGRRRDLSFVRCFGTGRSVSSRTTSADTSGR